MEDSRNSEKTVTIPDKLTHFAAINLVCSWPRALTIEEYSDVLKQLIDTGFDINGNNGELLFEAFDKNDHDVIKVLFENGAKIHNGRKLYKTPDGDVRISVFDENVATDCEEVILDHILAEDCDSWDVIISAIKKNRSRLDILNNATAHNDNAYKKKFVELCLLTESFPVSRPEYLVMRKCHKGGMTHPEYQPFLDDLTKLSDDRDYWEKQAIALSKKLEICLTDITSIKQEISEILKSP